MRLSRPYFFHKIINIIMPDFKKERRGAAARHRRPVTGPAYERPARRLAGSSGAETTAIETGDTRNFDWPVNKIYIFIA